MGKFDVKKICTDSAAATVFLTLHEIFPTAEWIVDVPALGDAELAGWWDKRCANLTKPLLNATNEKRYRDQIVTGLDQIRLRVSGNPRPDTPKLTALALRLSNAFNGLVTEVSKQFKQMAKGNEEVKKNFGDASASLLIGLCGYLEAEKIARPEFHAREVARLKLAEETRRLSEIVGDPPEGLKIQDDEGAEEYLKPVTQPLDKGTVGEQITKEILQTLAKPPAEAAARYTGLAERVAELRGVLILTERTGEKFDVDLAQRSILIAEAMTPEYSRSKVGDKGRKPPQQKQLDELKKAAASVKERVREEFAKEKE